MPIERPDLVTGFKNPLYNTAGFSALIPLTDGIDINACTIRFVVIPSCFQTLKYKVLKAYLVLCQLNQPFNV
jgi:hypothetical protein